MSQHASSDRRTAGFTHALVAHAYATAGGQVPPPVRRALRHCVLDWVGVAVAGAQEPETDSLVEALRGSGPGGVPLLGRTELTDSSTAALVNGFAGHILDYDDFHAGLVGHPTAPVLPAVLALSADRGVDGLTLMRSLLAAIETECRLAESLGRQHYDLGWHSTATLGAFGAAIGCCAILGLPQERWPDALAFAATTSAGMRASFGTSAKPMQVGQAARAGLEGALLAEAGLRGPRGVIEARWGFAQLHGVPGELRLADDDDDDWRILAVQFKRHASCFFTHPVIEGLVGLAAEHGIRGEDVRRVEVAVAPSVLAICDRADPRDGLEAKFSFQATAAYALLGIDTGDPAAYGDQIQRPAVRRLIERVTASGQADLGPAQSHVTIERMDGFTVATPYDLEDPPGDAPGLSRPLGDKFELLTDGRVGLPPRRVIELILGLEALEDVTTLSTALRAPGRGGAPAAPGPSGE